MLKAFQEHLINNLSFLKGKNLLIAISGGLDSVVLSHILYESGYRIFLAHCNFNLRGIESDEDEHFVKSWAFELDSRCHVTSFDTTNYASQNNISIQMAARDLRYNYFENLCKEYRYDYILTAHHLDDQLETFLINLNRGAGLKGLQGIPMQNGRVVRPLLSFTREQIKRYAFDNNLQWREDSSNTSNKYQRNRLRNEILPLLHDTLPELRAHFNDSLMYLEGSQELVKDAVSRFRESAITKTQTGIKIKIDTLLKTNNPKAYLHEIIQEYGFLNIDGAMDLLYSISGKRIESTNYVLLKDRKELIIDKLEELTQVDFKIDNISADLKFNNGELQLEQLEITDPLSYVQENKDKNIHFMDAEKFQFPLRLRNWKYGDRIKPFGMKGSKLVSDVLTDYKISFIAKEKIVVLTSNGEILWIVGVRASNHYKVTSSTKKIIKLTYII